MLMREDLQVWDAYPQLDPVTADADYAPVRPDEGLYYVNAFERLISTMETEVRPSVLLCEASARLTQGWTDRRRVQCRQPAPPGLLRLHPAEVVGRVGLGGEVGKELGVHACE